jgi:acyl carrier protein
MAEDLEKKVIKVISKSLGIDKKKIKLDSKIEDLSPDSIRLFQMIVAFEKEFKRQVEYEQLMKIVTVKDIISYIKKNV